MVEMNTSQNTLIQMDNSTHIMETRELTIDPNSKIITIQTKVELILCTIILVLYLFTFLYLKYKPKKLQHIFKISLKKNTNALLKI